MRALTLVILSIIVCSAMANPEHAVTGPKVKNGLDDVAWFFENPSLYTFIRGMIGTWIWYGASPYMMGIARMETYKQFRE